MYFEAYTDATFGTKVAVTVPGQTEPGKFVLQANPETYSRRMAVEFAPEASARTPESSAKYAGHQPEEFKIDILLDGTGVLTAGSAFKLAIPNPFDTGTALDVNEQIEGLRLLCAAVDGEAHRPHFVKVVWGALLFKGAVKGFDVDYKLFNKAGLPIRAMVHVTLSSALAPELAAAAADLKSPDITHERVFRAGDRFALSAYKIYKDVNYYIDVAKANQMAGFRKMKFGTKLKYPPIKQK